jgi:succinyl-CoA synthetase beta subunit
MKVHEYQARNLLAEAGIPVPPGVLIGSATEALPAFDAVTRDRAPSEEPLAVVKAQVHAGGRGQAGFVRLVRSPAEAEDAATFMLGRRMVSPQTGPAGVEVRRLFVVRGVPIEREYYLAIATDRASGRNVLIASARGGVEIERVAAQTPEAIVRQAIHPLAGLQPHQARRVASELGFSGGLAAQATRIMLGLWRVFIEKDCSLAEINPLVLTPGNGAGRTPGLFAIDAKITFDDNALYRHPDLQPLADDADDPPAERRAREYGLSYVALDGNIGCLVNGAGLAMATMDLIKLHGGEPANFLDVGGGASQEAVSNAFDIILSEPAVRGVLVNIFGGIMDCAVIARGIVGAAGRLAGGKDAGAPIPVVVRLEGTNVEAGRAILHDAAVSLPTLQAATDLSDAARRICSAVA